MNQSFWYLLVFVLGFSVAYADNMMNAATKSQLCANSARQASQNTVATTGSGRGAARGAIIGAVSGNAGAGAAAGAVVGGTRKAVQKNNSYQYYYNQCMSR